MRVICYLLVLSFAIPTVCDRCPQVCVCDNLRHFVTCTNKNLSEIPTFIPQYTQKLNLQGNYLKCIPSRAFISTPYLTHLSLYNCSIEKIEEGAFRSLGRLLHLNLGSNHISFLYQESFDGLSSLQHLNLGKNRLEEIQPGAFSQLGLLNFLNIGNNFLVYLPDLLFQGLIQLKLLYLSNNMINIISYEAFAGLPNLRRLSLDHNELQYLPTEALSRLSGLIKLELGWNPITFIPEEAFQMTSLKQLYINNMALQEVSFKAFEKSNQISFIDISNNQICAVQPLARVEQLKYLNLTGNSVPCDCQLRPFKEWADLKRLKVDLLCFGPSHFHRDHLDSIRAIDLKCGTFLEEVYNFLPATEKTFEKNLCPLSCNCKSDAKHAICENTFLRQIPQGFPKDTILIDLRRNEFNFIPKGAFLDLKNVVSLHLQHCDIKDIQPGAFLGMRNLVYLYLSNNQIFAINPDVFQGAPNIGYLFLDNNRFINVPSEIFGLLPNLLSLHMQHNSITSLSDMAGAAKLHWLYLTGNNISSIAPTAFRNMKFLEKLYLDNNKIKEVPTHALKGLPMLRELGLSKNPIRNIGNGAFLPLSRSLQNLYLNDMGLLKVISYYRIRKDTGTKRSTSDASLQHFFTPHTSASLERGRSKMAASSTAHPRDMDRESGCDLPLDIPESLRAPLKYLPTKRDFEATVTLVKAAIRKDLRGVKQEVRDLASTVADVSASCYTLVLTVHGFAA
ncbi:PREDICTED: chondroadherin-like protein [Nanorana parkeri]|uniref:chondroadherin-like protein n=1 Tax=Nanorana parkeri TaxID=125878 RepID=UPI000854034D|nr:PREDICTED: chondroadherin-like protein [Nanorana parkeri]